MQIIKIILFNFEGKKRELTFKLGAVNIIIGATNTGKSTILSIIDYCLGADIKVSGDIAHSKVSWFAIALCVGNKNVFIARKNLENSDFIFKDYYTKDIVLNEKTESTTDIRLIWRKLKEILNLPNKPIVDDNYGSINLEFKHSSLFCFQPKTDIDQNRILFYNQGGLHKQIIQTFPYFLDAVNLDLNKYKTAIKEENEKIRKLRKTKKNLEEVEKGQEQIFNKIIQQHPSITSNNNKKRGLHQNLNDIINKAEQEIKTINHFDDLKQIQESRKEITDKINELKIKKEAKKEEYQIALDIYNCEKIKEEKRQRTITYYAEAANQQANRLQSNELFTLQIFSKKNTCPLCDQPYIHPIPTIENIKKSYEKIKIDINITEKHIKNLQYKKRLEKYKKHTKFKEDEVSKIENQIIIENQKLKELDSPEQLEIENKRREALGAVNAIKIVFEQQISNTLGRNNLTRPKNSNNIKNEIKEIEIEIKETNRYIDYLIEKIEKGNPKMKLTKNLVNLSKKMTEWAKSLSFEYSEAEINFKLEDLTVTFLKEGGIEHLALKDISGQKNCIAAHLLIHFALHHFFIENEVSVPNFLVLDKFLQAFEENEKDQVIDFIFKRVQELDSKFQVIILEKEDLLNNSQYQNAIVPEWKVNRVLVPPDWYE